MNVDEKSLETVFLIAIWQSKTLFLTIFLSSFIESINFFDCRLSGVILIPSTWGKGITNFLLADPECFIPQTAIYTTADDKFLPSLLFARGEKS